PGRARARHRGGGGRWGAPGAFVWPVPLVDAGLSLGPALPAPGFGSRRPFARVGRWSFGVADGADGTWLSLSAGSCYGWSQVVKPGFAGRFAP
ncbi:hypothetical protein ABZ914_15580, partial [Spirillospora sp. NPDC046719]